MKRSIALAVLAASLAGCGVTQQLVEVPVPVPVECREKEPARPAMPTEALQPTPVGGDLLAEHFAKVNALLAEIEIREGYEIELVTALRNCTKPVDPAGGRRAS